MYMRIPPIRSNAQKAIQEFYLMKITHDTQTSMYTKIYSFPGSYF